MALSNLAGWAEDKAASAACGVACGAALLKEWNIPENYIACCFVLLGYCEGEYPKEKPRRENRGRIIE